MFVDVDHRAGRWAEIPIGPHHVLVGHQPDIEHIQDREQGADSGVGVSVLDVGDRRLADTDPASEVGLSHVALLPLGRD
jgi:hypothetical protein